MAKLNWGMSGRGRPSEKVGRMGKLLWWPSTIRGRVADLGRCVNHHYADKISVGDPPLVIVGILNGAVMFVADLLRTNAMSSLHVQLEWVRVSSYPGASLQPDGALNLCELIPTMSVLQNRHVLIVDDILDTGRTLAAVRQMVLEKFPASLKELVLLRKEPPIAEAARAREAGAAPRESLDLLGVGFEVSNRFVVGYGMNYGDRFRGLSSIYELEVDDD